MNIGNARISTGERGLALKFGMIALEVVLPLIARAFWKIDVRHYSGASD